MLNNARIHTKAMEELRTQFVDLRQALQEMKDVVSAQNRSGNFKDNGNQTQMTATWSTTPSSGQNGTGSNGHWTKENGRWNFKDNENQTRMTASWSTTPSSGQSGTRNDGDWSNGHGRWNGQWRSGGTWNTTSSSSSSSSGWWSP